MTPSEIINTKGCAAGDAVTLGGQCGHVVGEREENLIDRVDRVAALALGSAHAPHTRPLGVRQPALLVVHVQTVVALHTAKHQTSHITNQ